MSCCSVSSIAYADMNRSSAREELRIASKSLGQGLHQTDLSVPGVHCAACIWTIESGLQKLPDVEHVRVNLSTKRVSVKWRGEQSPDLLTALEELGFPAHLGEADGHDKDPELGRLIRALAVAGFSAMNIMLLSVSVWSGADAETRHVFHWISAGLALPCLLYSGRIFLLSACSTLRHGRTNMDVPISVGVSLAFGLSLYDTIHNGPHAYFDAATSLIFFLLIGRTLDHIMREKARIAVRGLMRLAPRGATVLREDGSRDYLPITEIEPGMRITLAAGDRIPVDGVVQDGVSDLDCAVATGESAPQRVRAGSGVRAGTLNLSAPLVILASVRAENSFLSEMVRLMEAAEGGRARYRRIADRAAALYSPVVHTTALLTFLGWMAVSGDWHQAITIAIAVLIITCPCALGLAVPIVQVVAARRLFEKGIMVKDGSAFERMAEIDTVIFDKTGTLTLGRPKLLNHETIPQDALKIAASMAQHSKHPLSVAIAAASHGCDAALSGLRELPGLGIEGMLDGEVYRLGRAEWAVASDHNTVETNTVLARNGRMIAGFSFGDTERPQARAAVDELRAYGIELQILSGDLLPMARGIGARLAIGNVAAGLLPAEKLEQLRALTSKGRRVLMVGDGLNDVPALAAAHVSMAPASAADVGRNAADFVFLRDGLDAVPAALSISLEAGKLVRQNFALAIGYNAIALPIATAGYVTPLIAALAMSLSSIVVVANALRLGKTKPGAHVLQSKAAQDLHPAMEASR